MTRPEGREPRQWLGARALACVQLAAFPTAAALVLTHHVGAAAIVIGGVAVCGLPWVASLAVASRRLARRGDAP